MLAENLRRALNGGGEALLAYTPQVRALALISSGERHAIAPWGRLSLTHSLWLHATCCGKLEKKAYGISQNCQQGKAAFREKRTPVFNGI